MGMFMLVAIMGAVGTLVSTLLYVRSEKDSDLQGASAFASVILMLITGIGILGVVFSFPAVTGSSGNSVAELEGFYQTNFAAYKFTSQDTAIYLSEADVRKSIEQIGVSEEVVALRIKELRSAAMKYNTDLAKQRFNETTWLYWPLWRDAPDYLKPVVIGQ